MVIVFGYIKLFSTMENNEQKLNTQKISSSQFQDCKISLIKKNTILSPENK